MIEQQTQWASASVMFVSLAMTIAGCAPAKHPVQIQMETMRKEQEPSLLFERGKAYLAIGDITRAEEYLSSSIEAGYDARKAMPHLLKACVLGSRFRQALDHGEAYLRKNPDDLDATFVLGTVHSALGQAAEAKVYLAKVLKARPDNAEIHYALATIYRDIDKDPIMSDKHFREYLRIDPKGEHAREARGNLLEAVPVEAPLRADVQVTEGAASAKDPAPVEVNTLREVPQPPVTPTATKKVTPRGTTTKALPSQEKK